MVFAAEAPVVAALDRVVQAQAVAAGIGVAMSDKGKKILRDLMDEAFPELRG